MRAVSLLLLLAACGSSKYQLQEGEILARDLELPLGARPGMFITWRTNASGKPGGVVEETTACVAAAPLTIEWRKKRADGRVEITAARFQPDGTLIGAWRGTAGSRGQSLKVVGGPPKYVEDVDPEVQRQARRFGMGSRDLDLGHKRGEEELKTPAGTFDCIYDGLHSSKFLTTSRVTVHMAKMPLPLSQVVKAEYRGPGMRFTQELIAYGDRGAKPLLTLPR